MATHTATAPTRTPAQLFALAIGAVYLLVGLLGLFVTDNFAGGQADDKLILFRVNHLHNIVHLALGGIWLAASTRADLARTANLGLGLVLLLVAALGFAMPNLMTDLLNIGGRAAPDNWLHLVTGAVSVYFGTAGARAPAAGARPL